MPNISSPDSYLTKEQLAVELNLPSTRMIDGMVSRRMIPFTRLGHRTLRFQRDRVREALERYQINAIG